MLDSLLGNVFGRSKKDKNANNSNNPNVGPNGETSEGFVVLGQQQTTFTEGSEDQLYPRVATMLTQEMIVGQNVGGAHSMVISAQHTRVQSYSSPIDNIPFSPLLASGQPLADSHSMSDTKCLETINRIQQYLYTESQSEYTFYLENTILSESLLS